MPPLVEGPALITFVGGMESGPASELIAGAHEAIALDLFATAVESRAFERCYLVTDRPSLAERAPAGVIVEPGGHGFHFGRRLRQLIADRGLRRPLYLSRGALPFITAADLRGMADSLATSDRLVITNNQFSADLIGFTPPDALDRIDLPPLDNPLARQLHQEAGLPFSVLERSAMSQFDVDTPTDLLVMQAHGGAGERTRRYLASLDLDVERVLRAIRPLTVLGGEVIIAGRVGSPTWQRLERDTQARVRLFSEERGMKADAREGRARSVLGYLLEARGPAGLFATLAEMGNSAFIDSRVLFAHLGLNLSTEDRFQSDLLNWRQIANPVAAELTRAAAEAPIPIVLGGHSLVSGGLWALVDAAWTTAGR
jgi:hypothetical protein